VVAELLGDGLSQCHRSARAADAADEQAVWIVSERIAAEVDALLDASPAIDAASPEATEPSCGCACGAPAAEETLNVGTTTVRVHGLALIFDHLFRQGLKPGEAGAEQLLATVGIYHEIPDDRRAAYQTALATAYEDYCDKRTNQRTHPT
jgi:hypothetical protein